MASKTIEALLAQRFTNARSFRSAIEVADAIAAHIRSNGVAPSKGAVVRSSSLAWQTVSDRWPTDEEMAVLLKENGGVSKGKVKQERPVLRISEALEQTAKAMYGDHLVPGTYTSDNGHGAYDFQVGPNLEPHVFAWRLHVEEVGKFMRAFAAVTQNAALIDDMAA